MDKRLRLIKSLHERTKAGGLEWEPTDKAGVFEVAFANYSVRLKSAWNPELQEDDYVLSIYNAAGELVDDFADTEVPAAGDVTAFLLMRDTHETARRIAMGVERALDALLAELDDSEPS